MHVSTGALAHFKPKPTDGADVMSAEDFMNFLSAFPGADAVPPEQ